MTAVNKFPVFDGHNDTLLDLYRPDRGGGRSFFEWSENGHIDLPRAKEGASAAASSRSSCRRTPRRHGRIWTIRLARECCRRRSKSATRSRRRWR